MNEILKDIKEVHEGGTYQANYYLEHGYVLLDIQNVSAARRFPEENRVPGQQYYVGRNLIYVVGRPWLTEHVEPPPLKPAYVPWPESGKGTQVTEKEK